MNSIEKAVAKLTSSGSKSVDSNSQAHGLQYQATPVHRANVQNASNDKRNKSLQSKIVAEPESRPTEVITLPISKFDKKGMIDPGKPRSLIAEQYRSIKRPLLRYIDAHPVETPSAKSSNLIMMTSSVEGEGKTFSAINLALSIAMEREKTVLLVDADIVKATAGQLIGVDRNKAGLMDLLRGNVPSLGDVILQTDMPNLRFLPAGSRDDHSTELLASESMKRVVDELAARYSDRVIIFDTPPILMTNEAKILANLMGQAVFVVAAESTGHHVVSEAQSYLASDCHVGLILNKSTTLHDGGYGYNYGEA